MIALHMVRRKAIYEELHPETAHGGERSSSRKNCDLPARFSAETAKATGRHERTVQLDAYRGKALGDDLKLIEGTSLDKGASCSARKANIE